MLNNLYRNYIEPIRSFDRPARLFLIMIVVDGLIYSGWQLFFNFYMLQSGYRLEFLGLVNSMPSAAGLLFGIPAGRISDRIGRKPSLMLGLGFSSLFMLAQITFRHPVIIAASAFLAGIFNTLFLISQAPLMVKLSTTGNRTMLFSLNYGLQTMSGAVGALFAGQLPGLFGILLMVQEHSATAYQAVLITSILLGTTALIPLWLMKEPQGRPAPGKTPTSIAGRSPVTNGLRSSLAVMTAKMTAPQIMIGFGAAILIPYMNVFFKSRFNISDSLLGVLFSISDVLIGVGSLVAPQLSLRLGGKIHAVIVTQLSSLVFLLLCGFSPFLWLSAGGFLVRTGLMNMASPLYSAFCMEGTPEHNQGFVNSILNLSWNIGWSVGPFISGVVQQRYGFTPLFISTAILYLLAIGLAWFFFRNTESRDAGQQIMEPARQPIE